MTKKLFTKVVSVSLAAAMVLSMAPVNAAAAKAVKPKSMKAPKSSMIKVGQTKTITATRKAKKSDNDVKYVKFSPKKTKNIGISVKTSDDAVVSVEKVSDGRYTYTGVNAGTATLTITSRAKTEKGKKLKATMDITVINPFKVTQTGAYTFTMSTADKLEKVDKRDVKVVQEGNTVDNAVKSVKISEDKMSVEVTMEIPFVDQKKYEVTFGKDVDSFVASVGAPAAINIKTQSAVINKATKIEYAVVDAKGMDVTEVIDSNKLSVEVTAKTGHYDQGTKKLTLWRVGDTAEVKVTYHSWTYDATTGKENVIEGKGTVTCVDKSAVTVVGLDKWTIADRVLSWDTDEMKTVIAQGESSRIFVRMKKSDGTYVNNKDNAADFTFDPITTATLYVYADGSIYATREGMEYAKVTYFDGMVKYQYTLPITVGAAARATTIVLNPQFVVIDAKAEAPVIMGLKVLDQYGNAIDLTTGAVNIDEAKPLSGKKVAKFDVDPADFSEINKIQPVEVSPIDPLNPEIGTGVYKLTYRDVKNNEVTTSFTVNAQDLGKVNGYLLKAAYNDFDISVHEQTTTDELNALAKGIKIKVFNTKSGVVAKQDKTFINGATIKINGVEPVPALLETDLLNGELTFKPVVEDTNAGNYVLLTKTGGYRIEVTKTIDGKPVTISTYINVTNTTKAPEFDKSYALNKVEEGTSSVTGAVAQVVNNLLGAASLADNANYYNLILHKAKKWEGTPAIAASADDYYLDTASLPSFKTEGGNFIWMTQDRLNKKLEVTKPTKGISVEAFENQTKFAKTKLFESNLVFTNIADDGTVAVKAITNQNGVDSLAQFDLADGGAVNGILNKKLHVKQLANTEVGTYTLKLEYTKNGETFKTETTIIVVDEEVSSLQLKLAGTAPADTENYNSVNLTHVTVTNVVAPNSLEAPANFEIYYYKKQGESFTEMLSGTWATDDIPRIVLKIEAKAGYKFVNAIETAVTLDGSGTIKDTDYDVMAKIEGSKLVVTLTRKTALV